MPECNHSTLLTMVAWPTAGVLGHIFILLVAPDTPVLQVPTGKMMMLLHRPTWQDRPGAVVQRAAPQMLPTGSKRDTIRGHTLSPTHLRAQAGALSPLQSQQPPTPTPTRGFALRPGRRDAPHRHRRSNTLMGPPTTTTTNPPSPLTFWAASARPRRPGRPLARSRSARTLTSICKARKGAFSPALKSSRSRPPSPRGQRSSNPGGTRGQRGSSGLPSQGKGRAGDRQPYGPSGGRLGALTSAAAAGGPAGAGGWGARGSAAAAAAALAPAPARRPQTSLYNPANQGRPAGEPRPRGRPISAPAGGARDGAPARAGPASLLFCARAPAALLPPPPSPSPSPAPPPPATGPPARGRPLAGGKGPPEARAGPGGQQVGLGAVVGSGLPSGRCGGGSVAEGFIPDRKATGWGGRGPSCSAPSGSVLQALRGGGSVRRARPLSLGRRPTENAAGSGGERQALRRLTAEGVGGRRAGCCSSGGARYGACAAGSFPRVVGGGCRGEGSSPGHPEQAAILHSHPLRRVRCREAKASRGVWRAVWREETFRPPWVGLLHGFARTEIREGWGKSLAQSYRSKPKQPAELCSDEPSAGPVLTVETQRYNEWQKNCQNNSRTTSELKVIALSLRPVLEKFPPCSIINFAF